MFMGKNCTGMDCMMFEEAIEVYEPLWDRMRNRVRRQRGDLPAIALNLMLAYRIVGRNESATALGWDAVERFPEDASVKEQLALLLLEGGETDRALQVVSDLEENGHGVAVRYKIAVARKDWEALLRLADRYGEIVPESERLLTRAFKLVARCGTGDSRGSAIHPRNGAWGILPRYSSIDHFVSIRAIFWARGSFAIPV